MDLGLRSENPCVREIDRFGQRQQIVTVKTLRVMPFAVFVLLVRLADCDGKESPFIGPYRGLDGKDLDFKGWFFR